MTTWQPTKQRDGRGRFTANVDRAQLGNLGSHPAGAPAWDGSALQAVPRSSVYAGVKAADLPLMCDTCNCAPCHCDLLAQITVQTARRRAMETTMPEKKPVLAGKRTHIGIAGLAATAIVAIVGRKYGVDLTDFDTEIATGLVLAWAAFGHWARKVAKPRVEIVDNRP